MCLIGTELAAVWLVWRSFDLCAGERRGGLAGERYLHARRAVLILRPGDSGGSIIDSGLFSFSFSSIPPWLVSWFTWREHGGCLTEVGLRAQEDVLGLLDCTGWIRHDVSGRTCSCSVELDRTLCISMMVMRMRNGTRKHNWLVCSQQFSNSSLISAVLFVVSSVQACGSVA